MIYDPEEQVEMDFKALLAELGSATGIDFSGVKPSRAREGFGFMAVPLHTYLKSNPGIADAVKSLRPRGLIKSIDLVNGFLNIDIDNYAYAELVINSILSAGSKYGWSPRCGGSKVVIEHTSANPIHQLHTGHGRNMIIGDTLSRLHRFCGSEVSTRFYVDDCGPQVMYMALGYQSAKGLINERIERGTKPDKVLGAVYSITYAIGEIQRLSTAEKTVEGDEEKRKLIAERDEWVGILAKWSSEDEELVNALASSLGGVNVTEEVGRWVREYERGNPEIRGKVREGIERIFDGFKSTLSSFGVSFDAFDWESEIALDTGLAKALVDRIAAAGADYVERLGGAVTVDVERYAKDHNLMNSLSLPKFLPKAMLTRSDGSTLYLTRDLAYAVWCLDSCRPSRIIRVIGSEQTHPQAQLRVLLHMMGYDAGRIMHYSYEMVNMPGAKMSSRRGRIVSMDDLLEEAEERVWKIVKDRLGKEEAGKVVKAVAVGAIRFSFLSISPLKVLEFNWDKLLDLKQNSGPFIQYSYVRASSILEKAGYPTITSVAAPKSLSEEEVKLISDLGGLPRALAEVSSNLRLENLVDYVNRMATDFNVFYEKNPVINAEPELRDFRLALVTAFRIALGNMMNIMGIPIIEHM
ncbi:arginine--tRNA ligase [Thermocladium modestius]|uniref:Arginine--tRNA ligase n=1 Tax=Thermocladium modestius TaxID=62609 RepID=A0A830GWP1_9CREN|nr:arginine--tRNA ligase [Thermocladium modestius]GGP22398.1 arginine--tRNA ligase [Thermocladium modestius]